MFRWASLSALGDDAVTLHVYPHHIPLLVQLEIRLIDIFERVWIVSRVIDHHVFEVAGVVRHTDLEGVCVQGRGRPINGELHETW